MSWITGVKQVVHACMTEEKDLLYYDLYPEEKETHIPCYWPSVY
jgi:hypothetical protein